MEKIVLIFCDINGTIHTINKNNVDDYSNLKQIINDISAESDSLILFSLASNDDLDFVMNTLQDLLPFIPEIQENIHFFSDGSILKNQIVFNYINSKVFQIADYIKAMDKIFDIQEIIIIDDCEFNHEMIRVGINEGHFDNKIKSLIPTEKMVLSEVNKLLTERNNGSEKVYKK